MHRLRPTCPFSFLGTCSICCFLNQPSGHATILTTFRLETADTNRNPLANTNLSNVTNEHIPALFLECIAVLVLLRACASLNTLNRPLYFLTLCARARAVSRASSRPTPRKEVCEYLLRPDVVCRDDPATRVVAEELKAHIHVFRHQRRCLASDLRDGRLVVHPQLHRARGLHAHFAQHLAQVEQLAREHTRCD